MQKDICFIENSKDIALISKLNSNNILFVPLNLETFLFCKEKNYEIFDFKKNISTEFHQKALKISKEFTDNLKFCFDLNYSLKSEIIFFLRFRFNSIILILEIVEKIKKEFDINNIIVSGLKKDIHRNINDGNIVTEIIENLFKNKISIRKLSNFSGENDYPNLEGYAPVKNNIFFNKNVLLSNAGYNFKRIVNILKKNKINVWIPFFNNLNLIKSYLYRLRGFNPIEFIQDGDNKNLKDYIQKITFRYNSHDLSELLNIFYRKLNYYFNDVEQRSIALKKMINQNAFSLTISNIVKGVNGSILDKDIKCNSLCVSHGIIAQSFDAFDKVYKKIIAEAVFNGESKFFAIQSQTMLNSLNTHEINGKAINTGNIVFSSINKKKHKGHVLHASTIKDFFNLQFLGVEMFYEYWTVLSILNKIAKKSSLKIFIKPHPTIKNCTKKLKKNFKNLEFSNKSIDILLKKTSILISYSSSTIEDALNSRVPVVLFDIKKGYKHIQSEKFTINNAAVYYVDDENQLEPIFKKIINMEKINFEKYIFKKNFERNFKEKILPIIG